MTDETICWFAGVDWGSEQHQVCILDGVGKVKGERAFSHGGAGLVALCDWLVSVAGSSGSVAVAIEVPTTQRHYTRPRVRENSGCWSSSRVNASISGCNQRSGIVGIRS
jgi:hypothetical protein